ncbi:uncharacterized protein MELLADRAFT_71299 [Melampsora larici-populina 98AG31]|uniref:Uncharacterized protein n=1 Tax=Melampsora larici-populina (strain 98AG31 / pathotype 3-4-7) TaxID=747676 RepID=F4REM6_MELLP|nr:uncharacterized protein MELLADRAFT_71299 [Melampsora larici-populina 98AG31]EGG09126.1 hypothetical protein MELLADRAFT_71299 [Melampsora larici-populina 98AG31]
MQNNNTFFFNTQHSACTHTHRKDEKHITNTFRLWILTTSINFFTLKNLTTFEKEEKEIKKETKKSGN